MSITAILLVAVIVMGVLLHRMYNNISLLGNKITYLSDSAEILLTDIGNLQTNIEATLEEETSLIESWSIDLVETDFRKKNYTLDVVIIPKEFTDNTTVSVYFGTNEFVLPKNGFSYEALISLPLGESFEKKVTVLLTDGKKKSTEILRGYKDVQHDFSHILSGNATAMPEYKNGQFSIDGAFDFALKGKSDFKFSEFNMYIMADNEELDVVNLKELYQLQDVENNQDENEVEADEDLNGEGLLTIIGNGTSMTSVNTEDVETSTEELLAQSISELAGTYQMKKAYELATGTDVRIFLRAVSEDGFTFEYDLFNGKIMLVEESSETEEATLDENDTNGFEESENYFAGNYSVYDRKGAKYEKN